MIFRLWPQGARLLYRCPFVTKIKWNFLTNFFLLGFLLVLFHKRGREANTSKTTVGCRGEKKVCFSSYLQQNKLAVLVQL